MESYQSSESRQARSFPAQRWNFNLAQKLHRLYKPAELRIIYNLQKVFNAIPNCENPVNLQSFATDERVHLERYNYALNELNWHTTSSGSASA